MKFIYADKVAINLDNIEAIRSESPEGLVEVIGVSGRPYYFNKVALRRALKRVGRCWVVRLFMWTFRRG